MDKIRSGDDVIILTGRDKGKRGKVVTRKDSEMIVVEGINLVKRHTKPNPMKNEAGGIVEKTMPIHQSNVAIFNPPVWSPRSPARTGCCRRGQSRRRGRVT